MATISTFSGLFPTDKIKEEKVPRARKPAVTAGEVTETKRKTVRLPSVTVNSSRPDFSGKKCKGNKGVGVIMADDPTQIYVTGSGWYGSWNIDETDAPAILERMASQPVKTANDAVPQTGDEYIVQYMKYVDEILNKYNSKGLQGQGFFSTNDRFIYLVDEDMNSYKVPTWEDFEARRGSL